MLRIHDFHINFQFRTNLVLPRDFQMALTHPWLSPELGVSRMDPETQWMFFGDLYRYPHVYLSALLIHQHFCTFWAHPTDLALYKLGKITFYRGRSIYQYYNDSLPTP